MGGLTLAPLPVPDCLEPVIVTACAMGHIPASRGRSCPGCAGCPSLWETCSSQLDGADTVMANVSFGGGYVEVMEPWACRSYMRDVVAGWTFQDHPLAVAGLQGRQSRTGPLLAWLGDRTRPCPQERWTSRGGNTHAASCFWGSDCYKCQLSVCNIELLRDSACLADGSCLSCFVSVQQQPPVTKGRVLHQ